jgi:trimethylamine--corrinoid protein Co-methyltransferase
MMRKKLIKFLSKEEVKRIREEAIKILKEVGVIIKQEEARKLLKESGASVNNKNDLVFIPITLTESCLQKVPNKIVLGGRHTSNDIILGPKQEQIYTRSISGSEWYMDPIYRKRRKVINVDVADFARVADALDKINIATGPYYTDADLNLKARDVHCLQILLENTEKPVLVQPYGKKNLEYMIKLGITERGSAEELKERPRFSVMISPVSPLTYQRSDIDTMFLAGKYGIPVFNNSMVICGATGPVTLAGWLLLTAAEHIAGVVLSQLANPGAPILCAARPVVLDMATGAALQGTVENAIMSAALAQVAREGFGWLTDLSGPASESLLPDGQCMIERSFNISLPAYTGVDILGAGGNYESSLTIDPVQLAIDDEIFGMTARVLRGITVDDESLGIDVIRRVGAGIEKTYITDMHTLKYFKSEYFKKGDFISSPREIWEADGKKDLNERAKERVINILEKHKPAPLPSAVSKNHRSIVEHAQREITVVPKA